MVERRGEEPGQFEGHRHAGGGGACLFETALKHAIAARHGLRDADRYDLRACAGCGTAYLLGDVWQAFADEGEIACTRCGALAVAWEGTRGHVAYWWTDRGGPPRRGALQNDGGLVRRTDRGAADRPPLVHSGR